MPLIFADDSTSMANKKGITALATIAAVLIFIYMNQRSPVKAAAIRIVAAIDLLQFNRAAFTERFM